MIKELIGMIFNTLKKIFSWVLIILEKIGNFLLQYSVPIMIVCIILSTVFLIIKLVLDIKFIRINKAFIHRKVDLGTISYDATKEQTDELLDEEASSFY